MSSIKRLVTGTVLVGALTSSLAMAQQANHAPVQDDDGDDDGASQITGQITVKGRPLGHPRQAR